MLMLYANNKGADHHAHPRSLVSSSFYIQNFKPLPSFRSRAARFESHLVANPEDRFSRDGALLRLLFISEDVYSVPGRSEW